MPATSPILADLDPWERIDRMPDDRPLRSSEAAVFMTYSLSTLERMRVKGTGPDYFQGGLRRSGSSPAAEGTNQHVRYFKADIKAWWKSGMVSSSMQAAVLKGQAFATVGELAEPRAFYVGADGVVAGMVELATVDTVIDRLGTWDIVWMPVAEAVGRTWSDASAHKSLADQVCAKLSSMLSAARGAVEGSELREESVAAQALRDALTASGSSLAERDDAR